MERNKRTLWKETFVGTIAGVLVLWAVTGVGWAFGWWHVNGCAISASPVGEVGSCYVFEVRPAGESVIDLQYMIEADGEMVEPTRRFVEVGLTPDSASVLLLFEKASMKGKSVRVLAVR